MLSQPMTLDDFERCARDRLPVDIWDYIEGGSGSEWTVSANRRQFEQFVFSPRVLVDVSRCDSTTEVLGCALAAPIGIAPMAFHRLAHADGETATAHAAAETGTLFIVSIFASETLEAIALAGGGPLWLQLYWLRKRELLAELAARAEHAGYRALVLTVDAPQLARRHRDARNAFAIPIDVRAANLDPALMASTHRHVPGASGIESHAREQFDQRITWTDLQWLRSRTNLPLVLKGVLTAADARLAVEYGIDAIIVSNHGGRQLDGAMPTLAALVGIVAAVPADFPVLLDGGIRHGSDIAKAIALGAHAVLVGRPVLWGLAHDGARGASGVLGTLRRELEETMILSGRPTIADLDRTAVAEWPRVWGM